MSCYIWLPGSLPKTRPGGSRESLREAFRETVREAFRKHSGEHSREHSAKNSGIFREAFRKALREHFREAFALCTTATGDRPEIVNDTRGMRIELLFRGKSYVRGRKIDPPEAPEGSSIVNVHLVVVAAVVSASSLEIGCIVFPLRPKFRDLDGVNWTPP